MKNLRKSEWQMPDGKIIILWLYEDEDGSTRSMNTKQYREYQKKNR